MRRMKRMKRMKRVVAAALIAVTAFSCCAGTVVIPWNDDVAAVAEAKTKTQTINLVKGDTYKIKIKKNSRIKLNKKKIVSVSKKGKIKALKAGKCTITIKKGKKTWKYNVVVRKKKMVPTPTPVSTTIQPVIPISTPMKTAAPGGHEILSGFIVDRIEKFNDSYSYVYLTDDLDIEGTSMPNEPAVKYVRITVHNDALKDISSGCGVTILKYHPSQSKIEGDTCSYDGVNDIRLDKYKVSAQPTPTRTPTRCYFFSTPKPTPTMTVLDIDINQERMTKETEVISGELYHNDNITAYITIMVNDVLIVLEEYEPGTKRFDIPVDFSEYQIGAEISVRYDGKGVVKNHKVWGIEKKFKLEENKSGENNPEENNPEENTPTETPYICNSPRPEPTSPCTDILQELQSTPTFRPIATPSPSPMPGDIYSRVLGIEIDQKTITKDTSVISGKLLYNGGIRTVVEIRVDHLYYDDVIASVTYEAGTETFSIPVDLTEYTAGTRIEIIYKGGKQDEYYPEDAIGDVYIPIVLQE